MPKSILFSTKNKIGQLEKALEGFAKHGINLTRIESRPVKHSRNHYEFVVDVEKTIKEEKIEKALRDMKVKKIIQKSTFLGGDEVPWFPRRIRDIDGFKITLHGGGELESDHPGFNDEVYKERREEIAEIAKTYKHGSPIPYVKYKDEEIKTWGTVFEKLTSLYPTHAADEINHVLPLLEKSVGLRKDHIPQLEDLSQFLHDTTGFRLRPVTGLLSSRDFLAGLAFRVFHSTQYIRHHSVPFYTPEPDICHEIAHCYMLADRSFADFSQEIGLASLGQSDEDVIKLATLYWFTVEFGLCKQENGNRAYGAGLLSSFGELDYCLSDEPKILPLDPLITSKTEYPITTYQPTYFVSESFETAKQQVIDFTNSGLKRPFTVRYDPYTETIEVFNSESKLLNQAKRIQSESNVLISALDKFDIEKIKRLRLTEEL